MNKRLVYGSNGCLLTWFFLDMVGLSIGGHLLVTRAYLEDGLFFLLYLMVLMVFFVKQNVGKFLLLGWLTLWFLTQWFSHWFFTFFGPAQEKIDYFTATIKLFPSTRVYIPDLYHLILHGLIIVSLASLIHFMMRVRTLPKT